MVVQDHIPDDVHALGFQFVHERPEIGDRVGDVLDPVRPQVGGRMAALLGEGSRTGDAEELEDEVPVPDEGDAARILRARRRRGRR